MNYRGRVFLLDDDELIVSVLSRALQKEGYEIFGETETDEAIDKICSWAPDVVVLDIAMPGRDGISILNEIKSRKLRTHVVMLTADDSSDTVVMAMKLGAVDYLTKPFNMDEVKSVINNLIRKMKDEVTK
jgi:DNA-binding response OmpR family regulator